MTRHRFLQTFAAAAALLTTAAHASPVTAPVYGTITTGTTVNTSPVYIYSTSSSVPAVAGSLHFGDAANSFGGLCEINASPCGAESLGLGQSYGPLISASYGTAATAGLIEAITPAAIGNYLLTVSITNQPSGHPSNGDIYNIVVNGQSLGTTSIVSSTSNGSSGTFSTVINWSAADAATYGGTAIYISVTDLLQQYLGAPNYDLPTLLGGSGFAADDDASGLAAGSEPQSVFALRASLVPDPEPASLSIFFAATFALGAARRRRRARATTAA
ncbi:MAG TPA: hypothetical protein VFG62_07575 [Rhodopila sp.]|nr:hypothetical protein [Rhodopila sp.]